MGVSPPTASAFRGRIGRTQFWAQTLLVVPGIGLVRLDAMALAFLMNGSPRYTITAFDDVVGVLSMLGFLVLTLVLYALVFIIVAVLASTVVCRLHDRGRSGWWLLAFGIAGYRIATDASLWHAPTMISLVAGALLIWGAIDLGVLPGRPSDPSAEPA